LEASRASVLISFGDSDATQPSTQTVQQLVLDAATGTIRSRIDLRHATSDALPMRHGSDAAYLCFTSGTTGEPKCVVGTHGPITHFVTWLKAAYAVDHRDRNVGLTGVSFDAIFRGSFLPLIAGGTLCIPPRELALASPAMLRWMKQREISLV